MSCDVCACTVFSHKEGTKEHIVAGNSGSQCGVSYANEQ